MKKLTIEEFLIRSKEIHGDKYNYSLVVYNGINEKIKIICPIHGYFITTPKIHIIKKCNCPKCSKENSKNNDFIMLANKIHNNKYDYSLVKYINNKIKIKIICHLHGVFEQTPNNHISKKSICPICKYQNQLSNTILFVEKSKKLHNNKYDYSLVEYKDCKTKVEIICPSHGSFEQYPYIHLTNHGCPKCNDSIGIKIISKYLEDNNIKFVREYQIPECKYIKPLYFDFYLPTLNILIEYNGKQHYESVNYWGGQTDFNIRQIRDDIKINYCKNNNLKLIIIKYDDDIINKMIKIL
jgi:hypothetical protein